MAILQALFSLILKSAGKILNAIFGWAVVALFGRTSPKAQTLLSALVAVAAAWPLLLVGIAFPRVATFALAFVPLSSHVADSTARFVWLGLAVLSPMLVGLVVAAKAPPGAPREPFVLRLLRGFPITAGIAAAFIVMFITVPALQLVSVARGRKDEHVSCITDGEGYVTVTGQIDRMIDLYQLGAIRTAPSWWLSGPAKVLQALGGKALRGFLPERLSYWKGHDLEVAFYPSDVLIRGKNKGTAWTHGLLAETLARGPGLQTFDSKTQDLERQIHQVWKVYDDNPTAHRGSRLLLSRVREITDELAKLKVDYDDWQVVYRQTLQLARALLGEPQILQSVASSEKDSIKEESMEEQKMPQTVSVERPLGPAPTGQLIGALTEQSTALVRKEIELAKAELREDIHREVTMAAGLGVAGVALLTTLNLLLVALALGLAQSMPAWAAALVIAGVTLLVAVVAASFGWGKRVKRPLEKTEKTLKENVRWAKERAT